MPIYTSGGKTYNIPDEKAEKFEASHPDAKVTIYTGGKRYNIPIGKQSKFKAQFAEWSYDLPSQPAAPQTKPVATTMAAQASMQPQVEQKPTNVPTQPTVNTEGSNMVDSAREYANANAQAQLMEDSGKVAETMAKQPLVKSDTTTPDSNVQNMPVEPVKVQPKQNTLVDTDEINEQYAPDKVLGIEDEVSSLDDAPKQEHEPLSEEDAEYTRKYYQEHEGYDIYEYIPDTFKVANQGKTETQIIAEWFNIADESKHQYLQQQQTQEMEKAEVADSLMRSQQNWLPEEAAAWRAKTIAQTGHDPYHDVPQTFVAKFPEGTPEDEIYWAWTHENDASKDEWELKDKTLYVDNIYTRAKAKQQEELKAENAAPTSYPTTMTGAIGTGVAKGLEDTRRLSTQTIRAIDKANELLEAYKAHQGDENFFVGAFKGFRDGISDIDNWVGVYMLGQMTALQDIMAKQEAGEELTQEEQDLVDALAYQMAVEASVADELGWGYTSGKTTGASLPFMLQMIASPATSATNAALKGLDKVAVFLGKNAVKKFGRSVLKKMLAKKATRAVVRGLYKVGKSKVGKAVATTVTGTPRAMIEGSIQTVLFHTDRVTADAIDRQMGNEMLVERANELFGTQMEAREGKEWTRSVLEAFATQASENVTEYLGTRVFDPIGGMIGRALAPLEAKAVGTMFKVADKMGVGDVVYRLVNLPKSQFLTGLAGRGQWNGLFGEYLEEVVNNGVNVLLGNMDAEDFVSLEQNAETLLGLAWTSLGFGVANGVSRVKQYAKAQEDINHVLRAAELAWADNKQEWESWKARIDEMSYDELREEMRRLIVANSMATAEQRGIARERTRLAMRYMLCRSQLMGLDATSEELREASTRTPSWMQAEDAQADGIVADEEGQADIVAELTEAHQVLTEASGMDAQAFVGQYGQSADEQLRHIEESPLDANTKAAAKAYILANERYEGVAAVAEAEIERKVRAAEEEVRANINPETNTVIRVSMKTGNEEGKVIDVEAYVIAGNINESGAVTLRMADGSQQMVQANKLTLVSETEADMLLEGAREAARQEAVAEVAGRMSNHVASQVEMPMEVGHRVVVNGEHGSIVATDGQVTRVQLDNGTEVDFTAEAVYDEAQYNKVSERSARAKEHVAEVVVNDKRSNEVPTPMRAPKAEAQIPTDTNGAKQYDQADPQVAWESILAKAKGNAKVAQAVIAEEIEILQSQVQALESASIPVVDNMDQRIEMHMQRQAEIDAINDKIARWQEVAGRATQTSEAAQESVPQSAEAQEVEAAMYAAEQERINRLIPTLDDVSTGETTAEEFVAGLFGAKGIRITPDSFRRETGLGTEEQRRLVGIIAGKDKGGVSIERAAEIIMDNYSSELEARGFTGDSSDVRGIIIDILGSGNPRAYAKQASLMRAEKELSQQMEEFDRYTQEAYHMSAEEYITYEESMLPLYLEQYKDFDETEFFNNFVDDFINFENYDNSRESTAVSRSSEVLHEEQSSVTRGDSNATEGGQGGTLQGNVQGETQNGPSPESSQQIAKEHNAQIDVARLAEETGVSKEEIKQVIDFANKVGVKLKFAAYTTTEQGALTNGEAYANKREITISKLMLSEGKSLRWIMGHELTHIVKTQGTQEEWEAFRDFIKNTIGEKSWKEGIESRTKLYKEAYKNQSVAGFEAAMEEELCADQAGYIFFDANNVDRFLGVPRTLAQKIYDWFRGLVSNVPNNVKVAVELWGQMAKGNVEVSTDEQGKKHSIVGVTGARALDKAEGTTVRMDNMDVAEEMEAAGKDAETIWMATGWERGVDSKWKYDIMDYIPEFVDQTAKKQVYEDLIDAKTKEYEAATNPTEKHELRMKIGEYMDKSAELSQYFVADILGEDHPLIKAYPDLGNITIEFNPNTEDCGYYPVIEQIELGTKNEDAATNARNLAHELQHAIQHAEGFARGGNISSANVKIEEVKNILGINDKASINDIITYLEHGLETPSQNKALTDLAKKEGYDNAIDYVSSLNPIGYYNRLAGEVESRNASARQDMTPEERRSTPLSKSEDIAREEQIVLEDESIVKHSISPLDMSEDEKLQRGEMLRNAPAIDVQSNTIVATPELSARRVAEQWWEENVPEAMIYDTEVGEVEINKNSIESSLAHRYGQKKLDAITSLVEGFENAVYLGTLPDGNRQEGVLNHYFAYPINYEGQRNYVFCRAMQDANKNRLYVHEVFVEDKITKGNTLQTAASQPHGGISLYRDILANVLSASKDTQSVSTMQTDKKEISEKSAESKVEVTNEEVANDKKFSINDNNVASHIYNMDATRAWMWVLRNSPKGVRAKGYGYIDKDRLGEFQDWYDIYLNSGAEEYIQALEELKNKATKKAQEYIDEVIAGVEKHRDDFRRLAEGDDSVLSTSNAAKFSITAEHKQKQLDIISESNPVGDDYHTWIRTVDDIKSFEEALDEPGYADFKGEDLDPSYTWEMVEDALQSGRITVYSSKPIKNGNFVTPSRMEAESYAGNGKVYKATLPLQDIAWIDPTQGQVAKVDETKFSISAESQKIFDTAKAEYGTTEDFGLAGYMLPDGDLLDFSNGSGARTLDHRNIRRVYPDVEHDSRWEYVVDFMNDGAIRLVPESGIIQMTQQPTLEQRKKLKEYIRQENGYVIVEINNANGNSQAYKEYDEGTTPNNVLADIDRYFDEGIRFSLSAEEQSIIDTAKANGTYMLAPNGEPSNLNEKQWAQVRTKAFKEWFGDWEKILRIEKLRGSNPIVVEFNGEYELNRDSAKQWMKDNLRGEYINADTGEKILLSKVGINEVTAHGSKDEAHLKSLSAIPSMIEGAVFIDELVNSKGHDKYDSYRYYVCGLVIDGVDYTAKIVVGVKDGSRYYDHRLTEIEKGTLLDNLNGLSNSVVDMQNTSSSVGKDTKLISILQTNSSKIVDENGEPMVVYHYTPNEFTEFDTEKIGSSTDVGAFGTGFYLSPSDGFSLYGKNKMALFVNAKNPMRLNDSNAFDAKEPFFKKDYEWTKESAQAFADDVQAKGYDAVYYENRGRDEIIVFSPTQIKSATDNVGTFDAENGDIRYSINTYHGSGAKFDKFDHAFMGSGEGAQAFGWGTYVTEVEGIAKAYADSSSGNIFHSGFGDFYLRKIREALANGETFEKVKQNLLEHHKQIYEKTGGNRELYGDFISDYEKLQSLNEEDLPARNLYTVEIPDDNGSNYLEWDKAINENIQQRIANGLKNIGFEVEPETNHLTLSRGKNRAVLNVKAKGMDLYAELEDVLGSAKAASQFLSDLGYTGIKYPAQATTGGRADNAQNYVIFNESDAQIVDHRRFSIPTRLQQLNKAEEFIKSSILGKRRNKSFEITLPIAVLKEIKKALGRDFDSHNIDANSFVHAKKEHGINGQKNNMSSIPLRDEDFALAPYIMVAPDLVQKGNMDAAGRESIRFIKNIDNGEVIVVEKEQKNSPDDMDTITMWADLSSNVLDARQRRPLSTTSETVIISSDSVAKIRKDAEEAIRADVEYLQKQANAKSGEQKYSLSPIPGRMQGESFIDYAHRVAAEVERQRQWQRTGLQRALALNQYEERVASGWYQTQEALQDSMLGLKALMQSIVGDGTYIEDIPDHENPYMGENRLSSVNQAEAELFAKLMVKPMLEEVSKLARNDEALEELTDYVMAKHGLERNLMMAAKEAQQLFNKKGNTRSMADLYSECRKKDYAGLTALTGEGKVADAEAKAQDMVDAYEAAHYTDALWDKINALNNAILLKQKESGMLSEKLYQEISGMYDYYIPLRGFDETTIVDVYAYLDTKTIKEGAVQVKAKGRRSKADSPWAFMQSMADQVIMQGNRNKLVKQKLLNFVMNHPSDAVSISRVYLKFNADENRWEMESPKFDGNETEQEKAAKWVEFASDMEDLSKQHPSLYKTGKEAVKMKYKVPSQDMLGEHQVLVRTAVGDFVITVQGNPRAAQAANGLTNPDNPQGWMARPIRYAESINRHLSNVYTSANPDFVYSNWVRDSLFGNTMVWIKESPRYAAKFHLNWMKYNPVRVNNLLNKWENNELDMSDPTEAMFYEFMLNGGETGYTSVRDIEAHKDAIKKELKKVNSGAVRSVLRALIDKLTNIARGVENGTRFAAYVTSMEEGRGIGRSIWDAKEISVNFNKKGAGARFVDKEGQTVAGNAAGVVSGFGRSLHVFWNAALQGTTNFGRQAKRHPVKALTALSTMYGLGYLVAMASAWDDDDDKKEGELGYLDIPEYTRRSNIVIKTVAGHWLTVPLPIEYRAVYGMGELCATVMSGKVRMSDGELAGEIAKMATQAALPVDIFAGDTWWMNVIIPSFAAPIASAYRNVSWTGVPIYKETPFNEAYPEWTKAYKGADRHLVEATRWLSDATGGNKSKSGWVDLNPAQIEYILDGYLGGWSTMTKNLVKTGEMVLGKREYDARNIPIWRRMFTMANEHTENRNANEMYWDMKKVYDEVSRLQRDYEKYIKNGESEYIEKLNALRESQDFKVYQKLDQHMSHINDLNRRIKEAKEQGNSEEEKNANVEFMILKKRIAEEINKMLDDARNI